MITEITDAKVVGRYKNISFSTDGKSVYDKITYSRKTISDSDLEEYFQALRDDGFRQIIEDGSVGKFEKDSIENKKNIYVAYYIEKNNIMFVYIKE